MTEESGLAPMVITVNGPNGEELSKENPGFVYFPSKKTPGEFIEIKLEEDLRLQDIDRVLLLEEKEHEDEDEGDVDD